MTSTWELVEQSWRMARGFGAATLGVGGAVSGLAFWAPTLLPAAVATVLTGVYLLALSLTLRRNAELQAAIDMRTEHLQAPRHGVILPCAPGDMIDVRNYGKIRLHTTAKVEVLERL